MVTPIVNAVNYEYLSFEVLRQITDGEIDGYTYHRDDNPTVRDVEQQIAALEGAEDCVICTTGMAACTMVFLTNLKAGDHLIIFHDTYGANYKVSLILERFDVQVTWLDADQSVQIRDHIRPNTRMIFMETPSNPLCKVLDIAEIGKAAKEAGALLVVDNTFATPYHQKPLELGADLVVHSATRPWADTMISWPVPLPVRKNIIMSCGSHGRRSVRRWMPIRHSCWTAAENL